MSIQTGYNSWAATYDSDSNLTRDLDQAITQQIFKSWKCNLVVEIGCGTGKNTLLLSQIASEVQAIDFSTSMIQKAKEKFNFSNVNFFLGDITQKWIFPDNSADLITCNLILEHIENLSFIFAESSRVLVKGGSLFICELHPFRQYRGAKANFKTELETIEIPAFTHHISDFLNAAKNHGLKLADLQEWWHEKDENKLPRLISFIFEK
jgi:ubiquinone/menaquinone biosynthesis C-methylase UbiE